MKSRTTREFRDRFSQLPENVQRQARSAYKRFAKDPYYPSLHFKPVHSTLPIYSVRINLDYRAVGVREQDAIVWFWVGSHSAYNKLVSKL